MTEVLPAGGAERGEGAVMAGWLDKRAGEWEFWHRYWAELRRDSLTFFTAEDPEHTLDADHLEWHAQRRLDLARCFSLPASAGGDDDAGGGHFAIRAPHVPTGCVRLRCGSESELREWLRNLDELLQPEPEPEPEAEAAPELAASPGKFAFKLPGTSSTAGSTPAFNFKPFVFQPRVDSGPADAAPTEPPQPPARAAGLAANPEPEPEPEPEPTGGTDGGGLFRFSLPFASQAKAGEEQSGAGPGPGLSEPQGFAFHGFFGEKKESGTTLPPPSLASALPAFGLGAGSSAPAFAAAAHKGEGVDQDRLGRLMARQAASQPAAFPGSAPAFAFREPAKGAPGSGSAASAASGFSFGGAGGYPSSQPRAFGRPAGSAPATGFPFAKPGTAAAAPAFGGFSPPAADSGASPRTTFQFGSPVAPSSPTKFGFATGPDRSSAPSFSFGSRPGGFTFASATAAGAAGGAGAFAGTAGSTGFGFATGAAPSFNFSRGAGAAAESATRAVGPEECVDEDL